MPVASNPLLQASVVSKPSRAATQTADKPQAAGSQNGGFDQVMARQGRDDKATQAKAKDKSESTMEGKTEPADTQPVADGGKTLPVADQAGDSSESSLLDASLVAGQVTDAQPGAQLIQAQAEAVAPVLQAAVQPQTAPVEAPSEQTPAIEDFDPAADPLANLPTLRLALEQSAQAKGTTSAHATPASQSDSSQPDDGQVAVNTLASLVDKPQAEGDASQPGEKAFSELLDNGLKDTKSASSDTRVDDFANRLASLTQAAPPKTANAVPPSPLHQPLPMNNQSAWAEGLVNRVMYLSSQNLKSADIQLEPAELGRLDIRVNVAADQSTQVTFISGHAGVREALDSQVHRLRELFAQQGLAQPDVNVADQSRGQQQQAQQEGSNLSGVAARRAKADGEDDNELADAAQPVERQVVIGDSAVDYYA